MPTSSKKWKKYAKRGSNKAKAICAELLELHVKVQLYNDIINRPGVAGAVL